MFSEANKKFVIIYFYEFYLINHKVRVAVLIYKFQSPKYLILKLTIKLYCSVIAIAERSFTLFRNVIVIKLTICRLV